MKKKLYRQVIFYDDYFDEFYNQLDVKVRLKINWTIDLIESIERIPRKFFDHVTGAKGLYEVRIEYESNIYRIFSFLMKES